MRRVYKYELTGSDVQTIKMPLGAKILTCQLQKGNLCLWALVNPSADLEERFFYVYGTGHDITLSLVLGTMKIQEWRAKEICKRVNHEEMNWNMYYEEA